MNPPLFKIFWINKDLFLYDFGTGRLLSCEGNEELFIDLSKSIEDNTFKDFIDIPSNLSFLKRMQDEYNLLYIQQGQFIDSEELLKDKSNKSVTISITNNCNLNCTYCYEKEYEVKNGNHISVDSIVNILQRREITCDVVLNIYGGEPLLNYSLLKDIILSLRVNFTENKIKICTNATLVTNEIAEFLVENKVYVQVSIDGSNTIHDAVRPLNNGSGSHELVMKGLEILNKAYGLMKSEYLSTISVIRSNYKLESMVEIKKFFDTNEFTKELEHVTVQENSHDVQASRHNGGTVFIGVDEVQKYDEIFVNEQTNIPQYRLLINGMCNPGTRSLLIDSDGSLFPCEKLISPSLDFVLAATK